jgi:hypothetical protein
MGNSLGSYKIAQSSSSDLKNIKWTQKNSIDNNESKNKKKTKRKTSPLNIIYDNKRKTIKPLVGKVLKIDLTSKEKLKNKKEDKKFRTSSASNCIIKQGFTRPAR